MNQASPALEVVAYLGLGSNIEPRREHLERAVSLLDKPGEGVRVTRRSRTYETDPWGMTDQPDFLNNVAEIATVLTPQGLLRRVKEIEATIGRVSGPRFGPRAIDVDILFYGDTVLDEPDLQIPHPRLHLRAFVLIPLAELAPDLEHPLSGATIGALVEAVEGREGVRLLAE